MTQSELIGLVGIAELITNDSGVGDNSELGLIRDAAVIIELAEAGARVHSVRADPAIVRQEVRCVDLGGRALLPGFVDSHSHSIFAGDRAAEFAARMGGHRYDGGGIAATVRATRAADDDQLRSDLAARVAEARAQGTTTIEIKSGYGLNLHDEARLLRIAGEFTTETTYLGGHVVPAEYATRRDDYVELVATMMLDECRPYARWVDVFCEPNSAHAFDADEAEAILQAGLAVGLLARVHGNQLGPGPGVQLAVELGAASVDHCTYLSDHDIDALADSDTFATLLPGVEFSTRSPYPNAGELIRRGVRVALATDCNPGTCYSNSMAFCIALAVREMHLTPAQALWCATAGAAKSLKRDDIGTIVPGARADLAVLDAPSYLHLAYRPGVPLTRTLELGALSERAETKRGLRRREC